MSKTMNISVLVAARDEYIDQLKCILVPLLIQGFNSIYQDALKLSDGKRVIWKFQELLKQIPQWNQTILQEESKRIKRKCPYIMDIVTAIFVTNVKILASVRLKGSRNDIRVKIPTSDIFIHSIYIESAQQLFYDPFLFHHKSITIHQNKHHVKQIIESSVDETIRQMLPFDEILQKYLADALNDNAEFGEGESDSGEEEAVSDSDEESINNDDLPSDESEFDEPEDADKDRIKSFNINERGSSQFIPDPEDGDNDSGGSDQDNEIPQEPVSHLQTFEQQPQQLVQQMTQQQQPQQLVQQMAQPPQQPLQQQIVQPTQTQGYSFF